MKYLLIFAFAISAWSQSATLSWQYNSNSLWSSQQMGQPSWFKIYGTNQLGSPAANWTVISAQSWTNYPVIAYDGTNYTFALSNSIYATNGQMFFTSTASNFWGESGFSNTSGVPSLPLVLHTTIQKGP